MAAWLPQGASDVTPITDDQAIREALADLTDGQPPVPPGRFAAVRKRAIRRRRRRITVVASVLAVAGLVTGLIRLPAIMRPGPLARPSWALQWPDLRNGSVPQSVLDDAVAGWLYMYNAGYETGSPDWSAAAVTNIVRLVHPVWYVGQTIDHGQEIAVMFEVSGPTGHRLVVGYTSASEVMPGHAASSASTIPWAMSSRPAPRPQGQGSVPEVSEYIPGESASGLSVDDWIMVMTSPAVERISWYGPTVASGAHSNSGRLVLANLGQLNGDVMLRVPGNPGQDIPVGIPGAPDVPVLAPPALTAPASFHELQSSTGQGNATDVDSSFAPSRHAFAVIAICRNASPTQGVPAPSPGGTGPLRVSVNGHALPPVECSGGQQRLTVPRSHLRSHNLVVQMRSSGLTAWQVAFGTVR